MKNSTYKKNTYSVGYHVYSKKDGHRRVRKMNKKDVQNLYRMTIDIISAI